MQGRWLSVDENAVHLCATETINQWTERKKLPAHKAGRLWKFLVSEVDTWIKTGKAGKNDAAKSALFCQLGLQDPLKY